MNIQEEKRELRRKMQKIRDSLHPKVRADYSERICVLLYEMICEKSYEVVHCYLPMKSEIDLEPLIGRLLRREIKIVCPKTLENRKLHHLVLDSLGNLEEGLYGTRHPSGGEIYEGPYDLILVPGLAFDKENYRLGYGGGYYDSFLQKESSSYQIGIASPFQVLNKIPIEAHDAKLDEVLHLIAL